MKKKEEKFTEPLKELREVEPVEAKKVDRLDLGFPNEDMNRVVAKLNEVIEKLNG